MSCSCEALRTGDPGVSGLCVAPPLPAKRLLVPRYWKASKKMMLQQQMYILHAGLRFSSPRQSFMWRLCSAAAAAVVIISNRIVTSHLAAAALAHDATLPCRVWLMVQFASEHKLYHLLSKFRTSADVFVLLQILVLLSCFYIFLYFRKA